MLLIMAICQIKPKKVPYTQESRCVRHQISQEWYGFQLACTRLIFNGVGAASGYTLSRLKTVFNSFRTPSVFTLLVQSMMKARLASGLLGLWSQGLFFNLNLAWINLHLSYSVVITLHINYQADSSVPFRNLKGPSYFKFSHTSI